MKLSILLSLICFGAFAQEKNYVTTQVSIDQEIQGTLLSPKKQNNTPLAILIAGSGPTDRDGNQAHLKNNSLKLLYVDSFNIDTMHELTLVLKEIPKFAILPNFQKSDYELFERPCSDTNC